ncbi:hypothetical protein BDR06DRAFT_1025734 [Suillus hirtellus]|nr:hypothetical protein BDR06DRAFT_1025734 [Suillus hirtellus]
MFPAPKLRLRDPGCQSCVAQNLQCYSYCTQFACERCSDQCSLLPAPPPRHSGIMRAIRLRRPRCDYCRGIKKICRGRTGEACTACQQLCSFVGKPLDERDIDNDSSTQSDESDTESEASGTESEASGTESKSSDSSDDVIALEHKPVEWIDRNPEDSRKRKREEEGDDDVILLDTKPADWVERKRRR